MDQSDYNCPAVLRNIGKSRRVWNRLGKMLQLEGVDPRVSAMFYRVMVQSFLLFGADT